MSVQVWPGLDADGGLVDPDHRLPASPAFDPVAGLDRLAIDRGPLPRLLCLVEN